MLPVSTCRCLQHEAACQHCHFASRQPGQSLQITAPPRPSLPAFFPHGSHRARQTAPSVTCKEKKKKSQRTLYATNPNGTWTAKWGDRDKNGGLEPWVGKNELPSLSASYLLHLCCCRKHTSPSAGQKGPPWESARTEGLGVEQQLIPRPFCPRKELFRKGTRPAHPTPLAQLCSRHRLPTLNSAPGFVFMTWSPAK